ncbi:hypothetical protein PIB30_017083 [Stylosanthes scabra]|uniref:Uncharacterized protein n=1 Tax=Stylosanthes scabra TaxID=79078 RepID=A0ABU6T7B4_9FABA|nr:hypothetical protein [Stylosanthes scabra]
MRACHCLSVGSVQGVQPHDPTVVTVSVGLQREAVTGGRIQEALVTHRQGGARTSHAHKAGTSTQAEVPATPRVSTVSAHPPSALSHRHSSRDLIARVPRSG